MTLQFTFASNNDIDELIRLEKLCFVSDRLSAKQFRHFISSPTAHVIVAKEQNALAGNAIVLFRRNSQIARLYSLAVDPQWQRRGIANALHEFIEHHVRKKGCTEMRLEVREDNQSAITFYQKSGYILFGIYKNFYADGENAKRFKKIYTK